MMDNSSKLSTLSSAAGRKTDKLLRKDGRTKQLDQGWGGFIKERKRKHALVQENTHAST